MDRKAAILLLLLAIIIAGALILPLTKVSKQESHNFELKPLQADRLMQERHYSLIKKSAYLDYIKGDFEGMSIRFKVEGNEDSLAILATSLTGSNKDQFNSFFYNQKTPAKLKAIHNIPANIIDNKLQYGFRVAQVEKDSIAYLLLPYDMLMGPLQKKNETQYEKDVIVQKTN